MPDQALDEYVEVQVARFPSSRVPDNAVRPAPRRAPELVALRAAILGLRPHQPAKPYPLWPLLIILGVALAYLYVGLVAL